MGEPSAAAAFPPPPRSGRAPKPSEVISYYKSKGLDQEQACEKAVEALQQALAASVRRNRPEQRMALVEEHILSVAKSVGDVDKRLSMLEAKVDSKPNLAGVFAAGVAAGGFLKGVVEGAPHVMNAFSQVSHNIKSSMKPSRV